MSDPARRVEHVVEARIRGRWTIVGRVWGPLGEASARDEYAALARALPTLRVVRRTTIVEVLARQDARRGVRP